LSILHEHELGWREGQFGGRDVGDNFPRRSNIPEASAQETAGGGNPEPTPGVTEGTPAAVDPNADGVNTRQAGTEEQRQASTNEVLEKTF